MRGRTEAQVVSQESWIPQGMALETPGSRSAEPVVHAFEHATETPTAPV